MWGFNDYDFIDLPNNYFVVRFHEDESWGIKYKTIILLEGPQVIAQHTLLTQSLSPYFDTFQNSFDMIATWVHIPNVPLHCYTKKYLWGIGDMIGRTLKVDMNTLSKLENGSTRVGRCRFARLVVEIDLQKQLLPRIICLASVFNIEYEGLNLICFSLICVETATEVI